MMYIPILAHRNIELIFPQRSLSNRDRTCGEGGGGVEYVKNTSLAPDIICRPIVTEIPMAEYSSCCK